MSQNVFLINDTEDVYHWGCNGTSVQIKEQLTRMGVKNIFSLPVYTIPLLPHIPEKVSDIGTREDFIQHLAPIANAMKASDFIVINGEGTIHDFKPGVRALLFLIIVAKKFFNKRVYLINHSCYPNSTDENILNYYKEAYRSCEFIAARESLSCLIIRMVLGVSCTESFDSLPLTIKKIQHDIPESLIADDYVCISGAVNYNMLKTGFIVAKIKKNYPNHKIVYLTGSKKEGIHKKEQGVINHYLEKFPEIVVFDAKTLEDWLSIIKHSAVLISGRYHYTIAGACFGTPMIYFSSNTPKIEAIAYDNGLPPVVATEEEYNERLDSLHKVHWHSKLDLLCKKAEENYNWPGIKS
ncbi:MULTISPECIES: polysaccharide pyruvyl transferase family protein [Citrobacter freundii complex]|uniref:polysaccharide pyruvyl transferase family protein n=1 Tax=Citrobacter freundii complex TaxID=1344959 RepID=UPI0015FB6B2A|nr:polysaccharide pyruvyl transferase family protein [Citrobacter freundii]EKW1725874.1 polysaccharide pyruvyl transferase family protein [Citrobacter freundii]EKX2185458.1 polysaccharide pyruvyl transferase family protein [Citrobacter freundii]ELS0846040.1 polysaccharide pyruvyl transferase family protein [Citrobacter freundii]MBA7997338.1 polysaccharide pyruvyl transferase family protein [Citrobacter freundii]MBJ8803509.1 polysaccharide pyruvyl transferase family protein [Citrobacter freundi